MIKIELGQKIIGALPKVDSFALILDKDESWHLGYWEYTNELWFDALDGSIPFELDEIILWIELPENPKELFNEPISCR